MRRALVDEFISRRLLTAEEAGGVVRLRPVHEALLRVVPEAVAIIKDNAALIRVRNTLDPMVTEWSQASADRKADFLATSPALIAGAAQLEERLGGELQESMRAFIAELLAADAHRRDAERSRQRKILAATAAGLVVALALAGVAGWQWRVAAEQRQVAEAQRARAENALAAATRTVDTLTFDLAREFRRRRLAGRSHTADPGTDRGIAEAACSTSRATTSSGCGQRPLMNWPRSISSREIMPAALDVSERARRILLIMIDAFPDDVGLRRQLMLAMNRTGDVKLNLGEGIDALKLYRIGIGRHQ